MTVVNDIERGTVEYVTEDREKASLSRYFAGLTDAQRQGIEAVAMDMWEPYVQATLEALPLAKEKIVYDRFHIMQHMAGAVDKVRKAESNARCPSTRPPHTVGIDFHPALAIAEELPRSIAAVALMKVEHVVGRCIGATIKPEAGLANAFGMRRIQQPHRRVVGTKRKPLLTTDGDVFFAKGSGACWLTVPRLPSRGSTGRAAGIILECET